ncbi:MAG: GNAT family N-acetyltransferase [Acidimicrobiia bacterium]|nr:GNAT family N-acetyltransferase [Acidimicrobiia bacterium]
MTWAIESFQLRPVADRVGPFPTREWLETWWDHRGRGELTLAEAADSLVPLVEYNGLIEFAGEADLTDYHSPLGAPGIPALTDFAASLDAEARLSLDSLPREAADAVVTAIESAGRTATVEQHNVAAVLDLPSTFDDYLMSIGKKDRHELRRKRRRFDNEVGPSRVERRSDEGAVALFARLHRLSAGDKGTFMNDEMEAFFADLHRRAGALVDVLLDGSDRPASVMFSFEDDEGFYLYNSAFEPELGHLSPGNVMLSHLIERSIADGKRFFDFLKGDENYKFRLGATPRPLYRVLSPAGGAL